MNKSHFLNYNIGIENHELMPLKCSKQQALGQHQSKENTSVDMSKITLQNLKTDDNKAG